MIVLALCLIQVSTPIMNRDDTSDRIRASLAAGTGGAVTRYAVCQAEAVIEFYDGAQTPDTIPDASAWRELNARHNPPPLPSVSGAGRALLEREQARILGRLAEFNRRSSALAHLVVTSSDPASARWNSLEYSNQTDRDLASIAESGIAAIQAGLDESDRRVFSEWLRYHKRRLVVLRIDYHRAKDATVCR